MTTFPKLRAALPPVVAWTRETALPFWGSIGVDDRRGGFHERLDLNGNPILDVPKRLMVQGRQLYVFCHAALLGWYPDGRRLADRCVEYVLKSFRRPDGNPGWIHSLAPDGTVANATRDTYAHAFVLLGLAWYHRLTGDSEALRVADETLAFLDEALASKHGGYLDALPRPDAIRRQNPHMHLFESFIALHQATGKAEYLARAAEIFGVFSTKFFQPATGTLCEYLTEELEPLSDGRGLICEPGHHYEWTWLLRQYQKASRRNVDAYCAALYTHADRFGWDREGFILDEVDTTGLPLKTSRRSWPHTEALKASIVEGEAGRPGSDEQAVRCLLRLKDSYLGRPVPAGWIDHLDGQGKPLVSMMPASTLYHVFCSIAEAASVSATPG